LLTARLTNREDPGNKDALVVAVGAEAAIARGTLPIYRCVWFPYQPVLRQIPT
jgi:hypothetical protein